MSGYPNQPPQPRQNLSAPGQQYAPPQGQYPAPGQSAPPTSLTQCSVEWVPTSPKKAIGLSDRAVVGGYEGDGSPLWVMRAWYENNLIPGKLPIKNHIAYVPWGGREHEVFQVEVCCISSKNIRWQESSDGCVPHNAVAGGHTSCGEPLYIGRATEGGTLTPGMVQPSQHCMYISYDGREIAHNFYETLCYEVCHV